MGKISRLGNTAIIIGIVVVVTTILFSIKTCTKKPAPNPAVDRLNTINDSLYKVIEENNRVSNELYNKLDSITLLSDTIIQHQEITNKYYKNETYNILNSSAAAANTQFRSTLKKSDSLLKAGFYTRTYNLRSATFQSQLQ